MAAKEASLHLFTQAFASKDIASIKSSVIRISKLTAIAGREAVVDEFLPVLIGELENGLVETSTRMHAELLDSIAAVVNGTFALTLLSPGEDPVDAVGIVELLLTKIHLSLLVSPEAIVREKSMMSVASFFDDSMASFVSLSELAARFAAKAQEVLWTTEKEAWCGSVSFIKILPVVAPFMKVGWLSQTIDILGLGPAFQSSTPMVDLALAANLGPMLRMCPETRAMSDALKSMCYAGFYTMAFSNSEALQLTAVECSLVEVLEFVVPTSLVLGGSAQLSLPPVSPCTDNALCREIANGIVQKSPPKDDSAHVSILLYHLTTDVGSWKLRKIMAQQLVEIGAAIKSSILNAGASENDELRTEDGNSNIADLITRMQLKLMKDSQPEVITASTKNLCIELLKVVGAADFFKVYEGMSQLGLWDHDREHQAKLCVALAKFGALNASPGKNFVIASVRELLSSTYMVEMEHSGFEFGADDDANSDVMQQAILCNPLCQQQSSVKVVLLRDDENLMATFAQHVGLNQWGKMLCEMTKDPFWRVRVCVAKHAARLDDRELGIQAFKILFEHDICVKVRMAAAHEFVTHRPEMCSDYVQKLWISNSNAWVDQGSIGYETRLDRTRMLSGLLCANFSNDLLEDVLLAQMDDPIENSALHATRCLIKVMKCRTAPLLRARKDYEQALKGAMEKAADTFDPFLDERTESVCDPHANIPVCLNATARDALDMLGKCPSFA